MINFKTGDRVKYTGRFTEDLRDEVGIVQEVINEDGVMVDWDTGKANHAANTAPCRCRHRKHRST